MQVGSVMDTLNRQAYDSPLAVRAYGRSEALLPAEQAVLRKLAPELRDRKLLDLGVGGGRTTSAMLRISHDYTAVDYSQSLVDLAKRRTGVAAIFHADVRDMRKLFKAESFDFVLFSFNGIDYMPHAGRLAALSEIHRVLKPGGRFLFSSHNRAASNAATCHEPSRTRLKRLLLLPRHLRLQRFESETPEYAILNDSGLRYSLLTYYIDLAAQVRQLARAGFEFVEGHDSNGRPVIDDRTSPFIHYLTAKAVY